MGNGVDWALFIAHCSFLIGRPLRPEDLSLPSPIEDLSLNAGLLMRVSVCLCLRGNRGNGRGREEGWTGRPRVSAHISIVNITNIVRNNVASAHAARLRCGVLARSCGLARIICASYQLGSSGCPSPSDSTGLPASQTAKTRSTNGQSRSPPGTNPKHANRNCSGCCPPSPCSAQGAPGTRCARH